MFRMTFTDFFILGANYCICVVPFGFAFFIMDWVVSSALSLFTGNGMVFKSFRVGKFIKG